MDGNISFNPSVLSESERTKMIDKLQKVTGTADDDECTYFTFFLARKGNKNTQYPYPE